MLTKAMTAIQGQWLHHVKEANIGSQSIANYAFANDLRLKSLYQWKSKLVKMGFYQPIQRVVENDFIEVKPFQSNVPQPSCTLRFANGNQIEFHGELSVVLIQSIILSASDRR